MIIDQKRNNSRPWALGSDSVYGVGLNEVTFCISLYELRKTINLRHVKALIID